MKFKDFLGIIRAPFLVLDIVCPLLGIATAYSYAKHLNPFHIFLVFIGAILANASVNALNEYFDFKTGLDFKTVKTPFSGGSGTLVKNSALAGSALIIGIISAVIVAIIGIYFTFLRGVIMLYIGLAGIITVVFYPPFFVKNAALSLISPGIGLGAEVLGAHYALSGVITPPSIFATLVPFFLVNNLLLLNQFPDREADMSVGRKNLVIQLGRRKSIFVYTTMLIGAYLSILIGVIFHYLSLSAIIGLLTVVIAIPAVKNAIKNSDDIPKLIPSLGMNVLIVLLTPLLLSIGIFIGK